MFPPEEIARKVTPDWLISRGEKMYPEVVEVWRGSGERGEKWLKTQAQELVNYLTGRIVYDVAQGRMVELAPVHAGRRRR
jgi:hypothetical protein